MVQYNYKKFIDYAINIAQSASDEVPVGCVVVFQNNIIAESSNRIESEKNTLYHAEILAINMAMKHLKSKFLLDCILFCTLEPCKMCMEAIYLARIKQVVFGAYGTKINTNENTEIIGGVQEFKCQKMLKTFFEKKREK